jgi:hypothetical protein
LAVGAPKSFGVLSVDKWVRDNTAMSRECLSEDSSEARNFSVEFVPLCDEELKVWLKYLRTTLSIRFSDHTNIVHFSAGIGFWTYVEWEFFAHLC